MRALSDSVALAVPLSAQLNAIEEVVDRVRRGEMGVEVRIGVGPLAGAVPARVIGHAACISDALAFDLPQLVGRRTPTVTIFSSLPKLRAFGGGSSYTPDDQLCGLTALGAGIRVAGFTGMVALDLAEERAEIPPLVADSIEVPAELMDFIQSAAARNANGVCALMYAVEHAADSMFADIAPTEPGKDLIVTLGAKPEARYWAVRQLVAGAAADVGLAVRPAIGLILRTLPRPWYTPTEVEPALKDVAILGAAEVDVRLQHAADISRGGNGGLKREARRARALLKLPEVERIAIAISSASNAEEFLVNSGMSVRPRLAEMLGRSA